MNDRRPESPLDPEALERIRARVGAEGPALVRRARRIHRVERAAPVVLVLVAIGFGAWWMQASLQDGARFDARPLLACEARTTAVERRVRADGAIVFDLGSVAYAVASEGADVDLAEREPCQTVFDLRSGRLTVHAKDLGGGALAVRTPLDEVVVRGTIFSVRVANAELGVDVVEGRVQVGDKLVPSGAGLRKKGAATHEVRLGDAEQKAVMHRFDEPEPVVGFVEDTNAHRTKKRRLRKVDADDENMTVDELVRRATEARRAGRWSKARSLYRRAGAMDGPTAEAAWVALARLEQSRGDHRGAMKALHEHRRRFAKGALAPEAAWIRLQVLTSMGDIATARDVAKTIVRRWPTREQAKSARVWLEEHR